MLGLIEKNRGVLRDEIRNVSKGQMCSVPWMPRQEVFKVFKQGSDMKKYIQWDIRMETKWAILS